MKHTLPPLDTLKAFEASARLLSFSQAADELCVSKGAVSYQIKKLEQHLNQALFKRATRQIYLTDEGQLLYQHTQAWFKQLEQQFKQISHNQNLTIAVTTYVAVRWLSPRLAGFSLKHPEQQIILQHGVNQVDFDPHDVDISIRWQTAEDSSDTFIPAPLFPVASPDLYARMGQQPLSAGGLNYSPWQQVTLLGEARQEDLWQAWNGAVCDNQRHIIEDANVRVQAAIDGQGIILADQLMQAELGAGSLVPISQHTLTGVGYAIHQHTPQASSLSQWLLSNR